MRELRDSLSGKSRPVCCMQSQCIYSEMVRSSTPTSLPTEAIRLSETPCAPQTKRMPALGTRGGKPAFDIGCTKRSGLNFDQLSYWFAAIAGLSGIATLIQAVAQSLTSIRSFDTYRTSRAQ